MIGEQVKSLEITKNSKYSWESTFSEPNSFEKPRLLEIVQCFVLYGLDFDELGDLLKDMKINSPLNITSRSSMGNSNILNERRSETTTKFTLESFLTYINDFSNSLVSSGSKKKSPLIEWSQFLETNLVAFDDGFTQ